ncbi:hypothetical protein Micbo1qcDRAFT_236785 [Microdochium bolleyi]|uniref:Uncharacterized protein n=1 Tax=Microdochium bolleyi TaxID=196109 RepID=A0A136IP87_9PEZI|nr:hypothetical protein Micbo1qcDRAFT_236785 [Microdochium bolleyi]
MRYSKVQSDVESSTTVLDPNVEAAPSQNVAPGINPEPQHDSGTNLAAPEQANGNHVSQNGDTDKTDNLKTSSCDGINEAPMDASGEYLDFTDLPPSIGTSLQNSDFKHESEAIIDSYPEVNSTVTLQMFSTEASTSAPNQPSLVSAVKTIELINKPGPQSAACGTRTWSRVHKGSQHSNEELQQELERKIASAPNLSLYNNQPITFQREPQNPDGLLITIQPEHMPHPVSLSWTDFHSVMVYYGTLHCQRMQELEGELEKLDQEKYNVEKERSALEMRIMCMQLIDEDNGEQMSEQQARYMQKASMLHDLQELHRHLQKKHREMKREKLKESERVEDLKEALADLQRKQEELAAERRQESATVENLKMELSKALYTAQVLSHSRNESSALAARLEQKLAACSCATEVGSATDEKPVESCGAVKKKKKNSNKKKNAAVAAKPEVSVSKMKLEVMEKQLRDEKEEREKAEAQVLSIKSKLKSLEENIANLSQDNTNLKIEVEKQESVAKKALAVKHATNNARTIPSMTSTQNNGAEAKLKSEKAALQKELQSSKDRAESTRKQLAEATKKAADHAEDRATWRTEKDNLSKQISKLKNKNGESELKQAELDKKNKELSDVKEKLKKVKTDFHAYRTEHDQKFLEAHQKADTNTADCEAQKTKIQTLERELGTVVAHLENANMAVAAAEEAKQTLRDSKTVLGSALEAANLRLQISQHGLQSEQAKIRDQAATVEQLRNTIRRLEEHIAELAEQEQQHSSDNGSSKTLMADDYYHDEPETVPLDEHIELQNKYDDVTNELTETRRRYKAQTSNLNSSREQCHNLREQIKELKKEKAAEAKARVETGQG